MAVSIIFTHFSAERGINRVVERTGGGGTEFVASLSGAKNCSQFCKYVKGGGVLDCCVATIFYAKCFNEAGAVPSNWLRVAFASQIGTTDLDPSYPNKNHSCIRI